MKTSGNLCNSHMRMALREMWPDANPLRRTCDRVEAWLLVTLLAVFMVGAPVAAVLAAGYVYASGVRAERASHLVVVTLLGNAQQSNGLRATAPVGWITPYGGSLVGRVDVASDARAGSAARAWVDGSGRIVGEPLRGAGLARAVGIAASFAVVALAALLTVTARIARWALGRRRLAAWAADWRLTEPRWVRRSEL